MKRITIARPSARTVKWTAASVIILVGFAALSASMTSQTTDRANAHIERGDAEAALHELKHAGPFLYMSAEYHALTARAHQLMGNLDEADKSMAWAIWLDDDEGEYFQLRSTIRRSLSSRDEYRARELGYYDGRRRMRGYRGFDDYDDMRYDGSYYEEDDGYHDEDEDEYVPRRSRWERSAFDDMTLWGQADDYQPSFNEHDRAWMHELDRLADTVREDQAARSWAAPRLMSQLAGDADFHHAFD